MKNGVFVNRAHVCHSQKERKCMSQGGCRAAVPMQCRVKGWSQPAVRRGGRECVGLRACNIFLPSPEETAASGTSPENSDGATFPQTP